MERLAQSETYYPAYQEGHSGVTAVAFGVCRLADGYWLDFNDSTFKDSGWTTQYQSMAEDENGHWIYTTGWAIPDANATYSIQWKVTDGEGAFYAQGPKVVVNSGLLDVLADWVNGGRLDLIIDAINTVTTALTSAAATKLALSAGVIVSGTVSHDNTPATTTVFYSDDITEATADHYNGRIVIFTSGALQYQATDITDYALDTGEGKFTITAITEAPADNDTFIIV